MTEYLLFYSWQKDISSQTNRSFIETCIKAAKSQIEKERGIKIRIDQASRGNTSVSKLNNSGAIHIASTIEEKIKSADFFISDVTSVHNAKKIKKKIPNPNVMYELGIASTTIQWSNIINIVNLAYGSIEELPFDIKHRSTQPYKLSESDLSNATIKKDQKANLIKKIKDQLIYILNNKPKFRLDEIITNLNNSIWDTYNKEDVANPDRDLKGIVEIKHVFDNIFTFRFTAYENGIQQPQIDWTAQFFINKETLSTADIAFVSKIDYGFKKIIIPENRNYEELYLIGVNYNNEGYGKQTLIKRK